MFSRVFTPAMLLTLTVVALCAVLTTASPSAATLFAYDPFYMVGENGGVGEYTVGVLDPVQGTGGGQNPDTGTFFSGPWERPTSGDAPNAAVLAAPGLSYLGSPAAGGAAGTTTPRPTEGDTNARISRPLAEPWDSDTVGTYYISYVVNFGAMAPDNLLGDMGYRGIEFTNLYVGYNAYYYPSGPDQISQKKPDTGRMTFQVGAGASNYYQIIDNSPLSFNTDGSAHLVVLKFEMSDVSASDTVSLYLDPVTITEPVLPNASRSGIDYKLENVGYGYYGSDGSTSPIWDEIRVGDTYFDVLPELPTPGDTDGDHDVDLDDYNTIMAHFNQTVGGGGPSMGDVALADGSQGSDGRVTLGDFRIWKDNYPYPGSGTMSPPGVPEPSSLMLALAAAAACLGYVRAHRPAA